MPTRCCHAALCLSNWLLTSAGTSSGRSSGWTVAVARDSCASQSADLVGPLPVANGTGLFAQEARSGRRQSMEVYKSASVCSDSSGLPSRLPPSATSGWKKRDNWAGRLEFGKAGWGGRIRTYGGGSQGRRSTFLEGRGGSFHIRISTPSSAGGRRNSRKSIRVTVKVAVRRAESVHRCRLETAIGNRTRSSGTTGERAASRRARRWRSQLDAAGQD